MPKPALFAAAIAIAAGVARAEDGPRRGTTYTTDGDVSQYRPSTKSRSTEIFILRGTEAKESQKDPGIVLEATPDEKKEPKAKRGFRKRGTVYSE